MGKRKTQEAEVDLSFLFDKFFAVFDADDVVADTDGDDAEIGLNIGQYLQKGEVLLSLAREKFQKKASAINLSVMDEVVFATAPLETDTLYDIVCRIARAYTRPLLRSMQTADDEFASQLIDSCKSTGINVELAFANDCREVRNIRYFHRKRISTVDEPCLRVTFAEEGYPPMTLYGLKNITHVRSFKNALYGGGVAAADMADFFAYLIVYRYITELAECARKGSTRSIVDTFLERVGLYEKQALSLFVKLFPESNTELLKQYTVEDILKLPIHTHRGKDCGDFFGRLGCSVVQHDLYTTLQKTLCHLPSDIPPQAYLTQFGFLPYCLLGKRHVPFHAFLYEWKERNELYWHPTPNSHKSKSERKDRAEYHLLADLFRIVASEKVAQKQMVSYYRDLERSYAKSYMLKKDITQKCQKAMAASLFNKFFGFVEFDTDTDLEKVEEIAKEFLAVKRTYLQKVDSSANAIRFRKLGQHKAIGLYYPSMACLCVDFRYPSSLIHEYGHLIDYTYESLSESCAFAPLRKLYASRLEKCIEGDEKLRKQMASNGKYNKAYYLLPTEIFARCFELYISKCLGVKNSIVPSEFTDAGIYPTDDEFLEIVKAYFDGLGLNDSGEDIATAKYEVRTVMAV